MQSSDLNLNISINGKEISCSIIGGDTIEVKEGLCKKAKQFADQTKESLRTIKAAFLRDIKKNKGLISDDIIFNAEKEMQLVYEKFHEETVKALKAKEKDLLK